MAVTATKTSVSQIDHVDIEDGLKALMAFDGHEDQDVAKNSHRNNQIKEDTEQDLAPVYTRARLDGGR